MANVELELIPWKGDHQVPEGEHLILVARMKVDGQLVRDGDLRISAGGFATVSISDPAFDRSSYTEHEYLWGTDESVIILPVTKITT